MHCRMFPLGIVDTGVWALRLKWSQQLLMISIVGWHNYNVLLGKLRRELRDLNDPRDLSRVYTPNRPWCHIHWVPYKTCQWNNAKVRNSQITLPTNLIMAVENIIKTKLMKLIMGPFSVAAIYLFMKHMLFPHFSNTRTQKSFSSVVEIYISHGMRPLSTTDVW